MAVLLRMTELRKVDDTFDLARKQSQRLNATVLVMRNNTPIMEFRPPMGDMAEIQVPTLKASFANFLISKVFDNTPAFTKRQVKSNFAGLGILKTFESHGGRL